jgi:hypothetical protein
MFRSLGLSFSCSSRLTRTRLRNPLASHPFFPADKLCATAARISSFNAGASILSPSRKPIARVLGIEAGVEHTLRIFQRCAGEEIELHMVLEGTGAANQPAARPHPGIPFPFLGDVGIGLEDHLAESRKRFAPPAALIPSHAFTIRGDGRASNRIAPPENYDVTRCRASPS